MSQHYMTTATDSRAVCGADMVGRRNSRWDAVAAVTTCPACKARASWKTAVAVEMEDRETFDAKRDEYNETHFVRLPTIAPYAMGLHN